jgi:hypothetical protein
MFPKPVHMKAVKVSGKNSSKTVLELAVRGSKYRFETTRFGSQDTVTNWDLSSYNLIGTQFWLSEQHPGPIARAHTAVVGPIEPAAVVRTKIEFEYDEHCGNAGSAGSMALAHDLLDAADLHDIHFVCCGGVVVSAHKIVLAARSPYFKALLFGNCSEGSKDTIPFPNQSPVHTAEAFRQVRGSCMETTRRRPILRF